MNHFSASLIFAGFVWKAGKDTGLRREVTSDVPGKKPPQKPNRREETQLPKRGCVYSKESIDKKAIYSSFSGSKRRSSRAVEICDAVRSI
jgi:hypothetical protein